MRCCQGHFNMYFVPTSFFLPDYPHESCYLYIMWKPDVSLLKSKNLREIARTISFVENEADGAEDWLASLSPTHFQEAPIIGITGPPGAGKSTLTDALTEELTKLGNHVAILCVDPSSPYTHGALLGDRIRMNRWHNNQQVYIRSLATRGWIGGTHPKVFEITSVLQIAGFDYILVETVGVGQSEIEIAKLADCTLVVLVPEAGDDVQTMKAGLMEIADVFVVNKSDRPDAAQFVKNLKEQLYPKRADEQQDRPIFLTAAHLHQGTEALAVGILDFLKNNPLKANKTSRWAERAQNILVGKLMRAFPIEKLQQEMENLAAEGKFNLFDFVREKLATIHQNKS